MDMPTSKNQTRRKGVVLARRSSFHGRSSGVFSTAEVENRAKTLPNLPFDGRMLVERSGAKMTKLLLNVTIQGSLGAVQVIMKMDSRVSDVVAASLAQYVKEMRRPLLSSTDPSCFTLHYSQFNIESIDGKEEVKMLGCRNFFLCKRRSENSCCAKEAARESSKIGNPWMKLMDFVFKAE